MPVKTTFEILRRGPNATQVHVGLVTDAFIAQQVIDRLYERLRQAAFRPEGYEQIALLGLSPAEATELSVDWDTWSVNNRNSPVPMFWTRPRYLWNSVPSTITGPWLFVEAGDEFSAFPGDIPNVIADLDPKP